MFKRFESILDTAGAVAVALLCLLIVATVISREFFQYGLPDSIILVRELMVPAILFPLSTLTARRAHVSIEVIANYFPDSLNRWIAVLAVLLGLLVTSVLLSAGWLQFTKTFANGSHYGGEFSIPKWPSRAAFVIAMLFVELRLIQMFFVDLKAALSGNAAPATL